MSEFLSMGVRVCICTDRTGSMGSYLTAVAQGAPEILQMVRLLNMEASIAAFEDYSDGDRLYGFTGWHKTYSGVIEAFCQGHLTVGGGADWPEAHKTALNNILSECTNLNIKTILILYTDAPPHHISNKGCNFVKEQRALRQSKKEFDWVRLSRKLRDANVSVYPIINTAELKTSTFYTMLSDITGGQTFYMDKASARVPHNIVNVTINVLLGLLGSDFTLPEQVSELSYLNHLDESKIVDENDTGTFLPPPSGNGYVTNVVRKVPQIRTLEYTNLRDSIKGVRTNSDFRDTVFDVFDFLLSSPTTAISLATNSLFGEFWREVCKMRDDPRRDKL